MQRREEFAVAYFPLLFVGTAVTYLMLAVHDRLTGSGGRVCLDATFPIRRTCLQGGMMSGPVSVLACLGAYYAAIDGALAAASAALVPEQLWGSGLSLAQTAVGGGRFLTAIGFGGAWIWAGRDTALALFAGTLAVGVPVAATLLRRVRR